MRDLRKTVQRIHALLTAGLLTLLCTMLPCFTVSAGAGELRFVDRAGLLSGQEADSLEQYMAEVSQAQQLDVVILTVDSLEGKDPQTFADDYYDEHGYGFNSTKDGVLFLLNMGERDWAVSTTGRGATVLTDHGIEQIMDEVLPRLGNGDYNGAFRLFVQKVGEYSRIAAEDRPVDIYEEIPREEPRRTVPLRWLFSDLGIGAALASIPMRSAKNQLRTVRNKYNANVYADWQGSDIGGRSMDQLINTTTTSRIIAAATVPMSQHNNHHNRPTGGGSVGHGSTMHMGSHGTMHGGSHGKF